MKKYENVELELIARLALNSRETALRIAHDVLASEARTHCRVGSVDKLYRLKGGYVTPLRDKCLHTCTTERRIKHAEISVDVSRDDGKV